jgi:type II secretory pathway component PulF
MARFCQVSHACLLAALNMSETVRLAGRASQSGRLSRGAEAAAEHIEAGGQLGESLAESGVFERDFVHGIATAEEVGKIDEEMARWSTAETLEAHQAIESAAQWLPKMGYAVVVVFVVYRIVTMMQGIYAPILQMVE